MRPSQSPWPGFRREALGIDPSKSPRPGFRGKLSPASGCQRRVPAGDEVVEGLGRGLAVAPRRGRHQLEQLLHLRRLGVPAHASDVAPATLDGDLFQGAQLLQEVVAGASVP